MLNVLTQVARGLMQASVIVLTVAGAVIGGNYDTSAGYVIGGIAGFCLAAIVFGIAAAILDMQKSLRILADAALKAA